MEINIKVKDEETKKAVVASKGNSAKLSLFILESLPSLVTNQKDLYIWNGKHYEPFDDFSFSQYIQRFFHVYGIFSSWRNNKSDEIIRAIKFNPIVKPVVLDDYDDSINLNNGVLNLDVYPYELKPHSENIYFSYCLDVDYDPEDDKAPNFVEFLGGIFNFIKKGKNGLEVVYDKETINNILQVGGYLLYPKNKMEKFYMFLGSGENGKSLLIDVFRSFFPEKYVTSLSLKTMSNENAFQRSQLIHSRLNIAGEEKGGKIDAEQIKRIVSGQDISVSRKFKEDINLVPNTKIVVDSNHQPFFNDNSHGTNRRLLTFKFHNQFLSKKKYDAEVDQLSRRIFLAKNKDIMYMNFMREKSAILNLFLWGLKELRKNNWVIVESENNNLAMQEYREQSDTLGEWLRDNYVIDVSIDSFGCITVNEILDNFQVWYYQNFPDTRFNYSTKAIGKQIKEIFRIDTIRKSYYKDNRQIKTTAYQLRPKNTDDELADAIQYK